MKVIVLPHYCGHCGAILVFAPIQEGKSNQKFRCVNPACQFSKKWYDCPVIEAAEV
jgi:hypothetical protein